MPQEPREKWCTCCRYLNTFILRSLFVLRNKSVIHSGFRKNFGIYLSAENCNMFIS